MGLCKCPQRKVSTLFCFKHHVNVCESCLVNEHPQCVVRSYVSWLQDNDYNPNCSLCQKSLSDTDEETIRLICYDLFHWSCLNEYFRSFPSHTAPDGYTCPTCHTCIFPPPNLVSPVADLVRKKLATVSWATHLPIASSNETVIHHQDKQQSLTETEKNGYVIVHPTANSNMNDGETNRLLHLPHRTIDMAHGSTVSTSRPVENDSDIEDKYKRRSVFTWFARWLRSRQPTNRKGVLTNRTPMSRTRYTIYMILAILFIFITILTVLYHLTRGNDGNGNEDSQFNPFNNPFIRVGGRFLKNPSKDSNEPNDQPK
ncbi:unnamed protein product [Adineta steineri]|uniref:RING-type domain-containing protein n=1 Tax=Adineta steineri TaxID=433720 RepID=A0A814HUF6_9BILA|nr:unnamed protein product [Adineta steineri]